MTVAKPSRYPHFLNQVKLSCSWFILYEPISISNWLVDVLHNQEFFDYKKTKMYSISGGKKMRILFTYLFISTRYKSLSQDLRPECLTSLSKAKMNIIHNHGNTLSWWHTLVSYSLQISIPSRVVLFTQGPTWWKWHLQQPMASWHNLSVPHSTSPERKLKISITTPLVYHYLLLHDTTSRFTHK